MDNDPRQPHPAPADPPSETDQILGRPADLAPRDPVAATAADAISPELRPRFQQLLELRDRVTDLQGTLQAEGKEVEESDRQETTADSATSVNLRDMAFARASTYDELIREIDGALGRIEDGTYGVCELTGERIPDDRLDAMPWTRFTAEAEKRLESEGEAPAQFHLPPAGRLRGESGTVAPGDDAEGAVEDGPPSPS